MFTFRCARHTAKLQKMEFFYTQLVGLEKLGEFKNHNGYDGLFLGFPGENWHLEFTSSEDVPQLAFDEDDCLVFYLGSEAELNAVKSKLLANKVPLVHAKNPYWVQNGIAFSDPDGYNVIFSKKEIGLTSGDLLTNMLKEKGIATWGEALSFIEQLPYGRNANRADLSLVISEAKGSCSSKHALAKALADLNGIKNCSLVLSIYKMKASNTPLLGSVLEEHGLDYLPEAHCYLILNTLRVDLTRQGASFEGIKEDVLLEMPIEPAQVNEFKVAFHKQYLENWIKENALVQDLEAIWAIREKCIAKLAE